MYKFVKTILTTISGICYREKPAHSYQGLHTAILLSNGKAACNGMSLHVSMATALPVSIATALPVSMATTSLLSSSSSLSALSYSDVIVGVGGKASDEVLDPVT